MHEETFIAGLRAVMAQLPYGKTPKTEDLKYLWHILPDAVTGTVTDTQWAYACQQRLLDPSPNNELPVFQQIMRHLYRLRDGIPAYDWGLRPDLPERMANASVFHSLQSAPEAQEAPQLPPIRQKPPESREQRRARLLALAAATGVDLSKPFDPESGTQGNGS